MTPSLLGRLDPPGDSREYTLFITHAWPYRADYEGVVNLLNAERSFKWADLSVTVNAPLSAFMPLLPKSYRCIVHQLDEKIREADCVLVLAAMCVAYRGWIQSEVEAALDFKKPIIAVRPYGQERVPQELSQEAITDQVGWRTDSIIFAIRKHTAPALSNTLRWPLRPPTGLLPTVGPSIKPAP